MAATKKNPCSGSGAGSASPERLRARLELRRSSAASSHVSARHKGSRQEHRRRAIAAGW